MDRHIELPKFGDDPSSRKWRETQVEVEKVDVGGRLAAMGAATAEVILYAKHPWFILCLRILG